MKDHARYIVITSIFPPTAAVRSFVARDGWRTIVVGDRKSPADWKCDGVEFLSAETQEASEYHIAKALPWNHYCRKMVGYVDAIKAGAQIIFDTDDDNIPKPSWGVPDFAGEFETTVSNGGFVNVYKFFTDMHIWARGFPLNRILDETAERARGELTSRTIEVGVWQGLADGDPDVDAIYRLTNNTACYFRERAPVVLARGTLSPFNSQNTAFRRELFPLLYLPAHVTFRFTDILRGLVAQPLMWLAGFHLGFTSATVEQLRNPHDFLTDFASEVPCYLHPERVVEIVGGVARSSASLPDNLMTAYRALHEAAIVTQDELVTLEAWLKDVT